MWYPGNERKHVKEEEESNAAKSSQVGSSPTPVLTNMELEMKLTTLTAATGGRNVEWTEGRRVRQVLQTKRINSFEFCCNAEQRNGVVTKRICRTTVFPKRK